MYPLILQIIIILIFTFGQFKIVRKIKTKYKEIYYQNQCSVCLEKLTNQIYQTDCHHKFHYDCLVRWYVGKMEAHPVEFIQTRDAEDIYRCPLCRDFLRSDYYNNMVCKPDGYQYSKTFNGDQMNQVFRVTTPRECADKCDNEPACHAYTLGYNVIENENTESIHETICRLYQASYATKNVLSKKKNSISKHSAKNQVVVQKHVIRNVCRKQTDQEKHAEKNLLVPQSPAGNFIKNSMGLVLSLVKAITSNSFFQQALQNVWIIVERNDYRLALMYFFLYYVFFFFFIQYSLLQR